MPGDVIGEDVRDLIAMIVPDIRKNVCERFTVIHPIFVIEKAVRIIRGANPVHQTIGVVTAQRGGALPVNQYTAKIEHDIADFGRR